MRSARVINKRFALIRLRYSYIILVYKMLVARKTLMNGGCTFASYQTVGLLRLREE